MLLDKIQADLKTALKEKDELKSSALRFLIAAIREKEIELQKRGQLKDEEIIEVIKRQVKQHKESIEAYQKGKREELAEKEKKDVKGIILIPSYDEQLRLAAKEAGIRVLRLRIF